MTSWKNRMDLARQGWHTDLRMTRSGIMDKTRVAVGFWAKTWYWSGRIAEVCLHDHKIIDLALSNIEIEAGIADLIENVKEGCERARRDFTDSVPCMGIARSSTGRLVFLTNSSETDRLSKSPAMHFPTESIDDHAGILTAPPGKNHVSEMILAFRSGMEVEDRLNTYHGRSRLIHDCKDREWGYTARLSMWEYEGVRISHKPIPSSTRLLEDSAAAELMKGSASGLVRCFHDFSAKGIHAGKTENGLPPGFMTLQEKMAQMEAERALRSHDPEI